MECCAPSNNTEAIKTECPSCGEKGKKVQLITLKSLLRASALETIEPENAYVFCSNTACPIVYFSGNHSQTFEVNNLKVPVYQKIRAWMCLYVTALIGQESGFFKPLALTKNPLNKSNRMFKQGDVGVR